MPEPYFYPTDTIPVLQEIKSNFKQIKKEILKMEKTIKWEDFPKYEAEYHPKYGGSLYENDWKVIPLSSFEGVYGVEKYAKKGAEDLFQKVKKLIPTYRNIIKKGEKEGWISNSFLSKLVPGSIINPINHGQKTTLELTFALQKTKIVLYQNFILIHQKLKNLELGKKVNYLHFMMVVIIYML